MTATTEKTLTRTPADKHQEFMAYLDSLNLRRVIGVICKSCGRRAFHAADCKAVPP